jgi:hypothetical protein
VCVGWFDVGNSVIYNVRMPLGAERLSASQKTLCIMELLQESLLDLKKQAVQLLSLYTECPTKSGP